MGRTVSKVQKGLLAAVAAAVATGGMTALAAGGHAAPAAARHAVPGDSAAAPAVAAARQPATTPSGGAPAGHAAVRHVPMGPVTPHLRTVALHPSAGNHHVTLPQESMAPFSLLGVTWANPRAPMHADVQVRTRSIATGQWTGWHALDASGLDAPDAVEARRPGVRGATAPLWVGPSDGVQLTVNGRAESHLPAGLTLALVDPGTPKPAQARGDGTASRHAAQPTDGTTAIHAAPAAYVHRVGAAVPAASSTPTPQPASIAPMPPIASRADWGADESMRKGTPQYADQVKVLFVHHTDTANDYTCGDGSAAVIRSLYEYHVKSNGWDDIGYNFLVDRCGTVYEGRYGGLDQPVIGAQTYGFNTNSAGVAVLGTWTASRVPKSVLGSLARLAAWKLGIARISPDATDSTLVEGVSDSRGYTQGRTYTFKAISGHRDGFATECPGDALYAQLPLVRGWAAGPPLGLTITTVSGATQSGTAWYTTGPVTVSWHVSSPGALVAKSELLVDGSVAASSDSASLNLSTTLAPGQHSVQVRATHVDGRAATSDPVTVVADTTAPTFPTAPSLVLRTGTVEAAAAPVTLSWKAADDTVLQQVDATSPTAATFSPTTTSWATTARPGTSTTFALKATDAAGNAATASTDGAPAIAQETTATPSGAWTSRSSTSYLGGTSLSTSALNASLSWTFSGRSVAWVVSRASSSGQAAVYVDGTKVATVDLRSSTSLYRQAIWTRTWPTSGTHTVKVVNLATSGRPTITTDALVTLP